MSRCVNGELFLPNDSVHAEIHLIIDDTLLDASRIDQCLLVIDLAIVHFDADKHGVVAASV
jgi:hypothetical protein